MMKLARKAKRVMWQIGGSRTGELDGMKMPKNLKLNKEIVEKELED